MVIFHSYVKLPEGTCLVDADSIFFPASYTVYTQQISADSPKKSFRETHDP